MGKKGIIQSIRTGLNTYIHRRHINRKYKDRTARHRLYRSRATYCGYTGQHYLHEDGK